MEIWSAAAFSDHVSFIVSGGSEKLMEHVGGGYSDSRRLRRIPDEDDA